MKTPTRRLLRPAAILFAAIALTFTLGACATSDDRETSSHTHAPGTPAHSH